MDARFLVSQLSTPAAAPLSGRLSPSAGLPESGASASSFASSPSPPDTSARPRPGSALRPVDTPDDGAVRRFHRALAGHLPGDDLAGPQDLPAPAARGEEGGRIAGPRTLGDAILNGLGSLSENLRRAWDGVRGVPPPTEAQPGEPAGQARAGGEGTRGEALGDTAESGELASGPAAAGSGLPPATELLALQRNMVEFAFLFEAVGKGTSKAIDNTNQLVKMQ